MNATQCRLRRGIRGTVIKVVRSQSFCGSCLCASSWMQLLVGGSIKFAAGFAEANSTWPATVLLTCCQRKAKDQQHIIHHGE